MCECEGVQVNQSPRLLVIIGSTRPGRVGGAVAEWIIEQAQLHGHFQVEVADLAQIKLPLMDEPNHPRLRQYTHEHTKLWSAVVMRADAVVCVLPEYNHGFNAALKNAIDYLFHEWAYTPVGLVSYGGVSAGTRAAQMLRQVFAALSAPVSVPSVTIPFVANQVDDNGHFTSSPLLDQSAQEMFTELGRLERALRGLREEKRV